ncbi:transcriptional regulator domain-containing protein [Afipia felis]
METSEDWLSSDFIERLKKLDRGTLSFEFLRRNKIYQDDYRTTLEKISPRTTTPHVKREALSRLATRWGLAFPGGSCAWRCGCAAALACGRLPADGDCPCCARRLCQRAHS